MAKFKIHKSKDYTIMSNTHLKEKEMSLKAKGLLSIMLSLPEEWDYSEIGLSKLSKDGVGSTAKALDELEMFGYLRRTQCKETNGKFAGYEYDIFETPQINSPYTENPFTEKPFTENQGQLNTNILSNKPNKNNKPTNTKELKKETIKEFSDVVFGIYDFWNEKKIIPHKSLTKEIGEAIEKALKTYKEEEIKTYIDRYAKVIGDKDYFWHYKWSLKEFLTRKDGISSFTDEGSKWVNYCAFLNEPKKNDKPEKTRYGDFDPDDAFKKALERSYGSYET